MVEYKSQDPKFFTFMSTDSEGFNSFFHCLIFYDEVNDAEINFEFDIDTELIKKVTERISDSPEIKKHGGANKRPTEKNKGEDKMIDAQRKIIMQKNLKRKETTQFLNAYELNTIARNKEKEQEIKMGASIMGDGTTAHNKFQQN